MKAVVRELRSYARKPGFRAGGRHSSFMIKPRAATAAAVSVSERRSDGGAGDVSLRGMLLEGRAGAAAAETERVRRPGAAAAEARARAVRVRMRGHSCKKTLGKSEAGQDAKRERGTAEMGVSTPSGRPPGPARPARLQGRIQVGRRGLPEVRLRRSRRSCASAGRPRTRAVVPAAGPRCCPFFVGRAGHRDAALGGRAAAAAEEEARGG